MSDTIKPVAWIKDTSLISLKRDETTVLAYPYDYLIRPAVPLYAADAIESLQAECERLRAELEAAQTALGVTRSQLLGQRVADGIDDGASFLCALDAAIKTSAAIDAAMAQEKRDE